jgi:hypothetical protein
VWTQLGVFGWHHARQIEQIEAAIAPLMALQHQALAKWEIELCSYLDIASRAQVLANHEVPSQVQLLACRVHCSLEFRAVVIHVLPTIVAAVNNRVPSDPAENNSITW